MTIVSQYLNVLYCMLTEAGTRNRPRLCYVASSVGGANATLQARGRRVFMDPPTWTDSRTGASPLAGARR